MRKIHRFLSVALSLAVAAALAVPAFASTVESTYDNGEAWVSLKLELDRDPIATELAHDAEYLPIFYVPVGTTILSASYWWADTPMGDSYWDAEYLSLGSFTRPDGTRIDEPDELSALFNVENNGYRANAFSLTLTQEGRYNIYTTDGLAFDAYLYAVAPGGEYRETVLARSNGLEAKVNVGRITAQSTVNYQGQQIPIYTVIPGTSSSNCNIQINHDDGASYVVNIYKAKNDNGTLTDVENYDVWDFVGQAGRFGWLTIDNELEGVQVYEFIENGVTIQTFALTRDSSAASTGTEQPSTPAPDAPGSYTVQAGDTWSSICTNFYGNNAQRYALMKANGNVGLKVGAVITLPEQLGNVTRLPAPVAGAGETLYTVKLGDTLGSIALAEYGTMSAYKDIFERNADRIKNVNLIYEGQVIVLPAK